MGFRNCGWMGAIALLAAISGAEVSALPPANPPPQLNGSCLLAPETCLNDLMPGLLAAHSDDKARRTVARELALVYEFGLGRATNLQCALDLFQVAATDTVLRHDPVNFNGAAFTPMPRVIPGDTLAKAGVKRILRRVKDREQGAIRANRPGRKEGLALIQPQAEPGEPSTLGEVMVDIYPDLSRKLGEQGRVKIFYCLGGDGFVDPRRSTIYLFSGFPRLDDAALGAAISGDIDRFFLPAMDAAGTGKTSCAIIPFNFVLHEGD